MGKASARTRVHSVKVGKTEMLPKSCDKLSEEEKCLHGCACTSVKENQNLSGPQRELLHWHQKLCLNMRDLQQLMRPQIFRDEAGKEVSRLDPVIPTDYNSTKNLKPDQFPMCLA